MAQLLNPFCGLALATLLTPAGTICLLTQETATHSYGGDWSRVAHILEGKNLDQPEVLRAASAELCGLGADLVHCLLELRTGLVQSSQPGAEAIARTPAHSLPERAAQAILEALQRLNPSEVGRRLLDALPQGASVEHHLVGLGLLGDIGDGNSLAVAVELLNRMERVQLQRPYVRVRAEAALIAILECGGDSYDFLRANYAQWHVDLRTLLAAALARTENLAAVDCLIDLSEQNQVQEPHLLQALSSPMPRHADAFRQPILKILRENTQSSQAENVREALRSLGNWRDSSAVETLLEVLSGDDPALARIAKMALENISGLSYAQDLHTWRVWWQREEQWYHSQRPVELMKLTSTDPGQVIAGLRQLATHRVYFRELSPLIQPLLRGQDSTLILAASAALERLGANQALLDWVNLLEHSEVSVRHAAHRALQATGQKKMPLDAQLWREWLQS